MKHFSKYLDTPYLCLRYNWKM